MPKLDAKPLKFRKENPANANDAANRLGVWSAGLVRLVAISLNCRKGFRNDTRNIGKIEKVKTMFKIESGVAFDENANKTKLQKDNIARNAKREKRLQQGMCRDCGKHPFVSGKVVCKKCSHKREAQGNSYKQNKAEKGLCVRCGVSNNRSKTLCDVCMEKQIESARLRRKETKEFIYKHFGSKCSCCGETDIRAMSLDHINNDGYLDKVSETGKKQITPAWYARLRTLIEANEPLPRDLQMLCFNCHAKKDLTPWWLK